MQPTKRTEFPNRYATPFNGSIEFFDRVDELKSRFVKLAVVAGIIALVFPFAVSWLMVGAREPTKMQVLADGRLFSGVLAEGMIVPDEVVLKQMEQTVSVLLTRTDKGGVKALEDYVMPGVTEYFDSLYSKDRPETASGFSQQFTLTSSRLLVNDGAWVGLGLRGVLNARTLDGYLPTEVFWVAGFVPSKKSDRNATGWRLFRLIPDPDGQLFFSREITAARAARLGLEMTAAAKDKP